MRSHPVPFNEEARVRAVRAVPGLTRENHPVFDSICHAAAALLGCPIAHISVVEEASQWYKSVVGIVLEEMPKNNSFCAHTIMSDTAMVVPDLSADPKFSDHPMVAEGGPGARFYAGVPLTLSSGFRFGSLCALDLSAHAAPDARQLEVLRHLGDAVVAALEKEPATPAAPQATPSNTFLTLVGHELRTPLTVMRGALSLIEKRAEDPISARLSESALRASEHLAEMVEAILRFSDVSTGNLELHETQIDLGGFLTHLYEAHADSIAEVGKSIEPPLTNVTGVLTVDEGHLRMSVTALVLNAIMHGGDSIRVTSGTTVEGHVEIAVHDNGKLTNVIEIERLYEPFVVGGDIDQRDTSGGLGLGLPLTRKLVELHGGELGIETGSRGTTARIRLPKWRLTA
ncbi:GAF domain-containing sensor histidine kinase [Sulfitobacter sp. S190]|uniref:GAF domain-containing sensor histidine kinase n=1 Tax=Sulfitobacter sp. S190 TaxID=2867022 RepID=UPI0021A7EA86|nr:GAF domain-containing sensor histidine kinase [Sulfitobacter sp. S190]UWR23428.1 GAF domain-containing sensor histidine kinase [Sulfitobacter sp. S190]